MIKIVILTLFMMCFSVPLQAAELGKVQLLLGEASLERQGINLAIVQGMAVEEGDIVSTSAASSVHIKAHDEGFIVVRPESKVSILCYRAECMKLNLIAGEMRQITGEMGKQNKQNFRLNTPVAAIGVRGTDFIAKTDSQDTWVRVLEGAIVAAPLSEQCKAATLGECSTDYAALLKAQDNVVLNIRANMAPVSIKGDGGLHASINQLNSAPTAAEMASKKLENFDVAVVIKNHPEIWQLAQSIEQKVLENERSDVPKAALIYSTWQEVSKGIAQALSVAAPGRVATVGDAQYVLWRDESKVFVTPVGKVDYTLSESQSQLMSAAGEVTPAAIRQGALSINFDAKKIDTSLTIDTQKQQGLQITAQGALSRNDGLFSIATAQGGSIAGAISSDAGQVGYMLTQPLSGEALKSLTMWQAK